MARLLLLPFFMAWPLVEELFSASLPLVETLFFNLCWPWLEIWNTPLISDINTLQAEKNNNFYIDFIYRKDVSIIF